MYEWWELLITYIFVIHFPAPKAQVLTMGKCVVRPPPSRLNWATLNVKVPGMASVLCSLLRRQLFLKKVMLARTVQPNLDYSWMSISKPFIPLSFMSQPSGHCCCVPTSVSLARTMEKLPEKGNMGCFHHSTGSISGDLPISMQIPSGTHLVLFAESRISFV